MPPALPGTAAIGHLQGDGRWSDSAEVVNPGASATLAQVTGLADGNYLVGVMLSSDLPFTCDFRQSDSASVVKHTQRLRPGGGFGGDLRMRLPYKIPCEASDQLRLIFVSGAPTTVQASIFYQRVE